VQETGDPEPASQSGLAFVDLPEKHSDAAPRSHKQEVDMVDDATSGAGNSGKHGNGNSADWKDDSPGGVIDEQIQKALGDAQSLEDTIPLDVTRVIKLSKGQIDRAADKAAEADRGAGEKSSDSASDATGSAGDPAVSIHWLQPEPGRAARAEARTMGNDANPVAAPDAGSSDPVGQVAALAPGDTITPVTSALEAAGEAVKTTAPHASPFAIDLLMSTTASRASLATLATGLAGMDRAQSAPIAVVPRPAEAPVPGAGTEPSARENDPVAGMGQEIASDTGNEVDPGTPIPSLAATALGVGLDEVVARVERALDVAVETSSLRRLLPWLAGAGLAIAVADVLRRQKSGREQSHRETVGADHDADTWLPRSITEKA
jgi:hypothetical protein